MDLDHLPGPIININVDQHCIAMLSHSIQVGKIIKPFYFQLNSPWKYDFVLRKATANLRIESLSSFERMLCSKGRREAR